MSSLCPLVPVVGRDSVKTHPTAHLKSVHLIVCKSHLYVWLNEKRIWNHVSHRHHWALHASQRKLFHYKNIMLLKSLQADLHCLGHWWLNFRNFASQLLNCCELEIGQGWSLHNTLQISISHPLPSKPRFLATTGFMVYIKIKTCSACLVYSYNQETKQTFQNVVVQAPISLPFSSHHPHSQIIISPLLAD